MNSLPESSAKPPRSRLATVALWLGILGLALPLFGNVMLLAGLSAGLLAIPVGIAAWVRMVRSSVRVEGRRRATLGMVLGLISVLWVAMILPGMPLWVPTRNARNAMPALRICA